MERTCPDMRTPWGDLRRIGKLADGAWFVSAQKHGGILMSEEYARKHIPTSVLGQKKSSNGYYDFEEDCEANIPLFFSPELIGSMVKESSPSLSGDVLKKAEARHAYYVLRGMSYFYPEKIKGNASSVDAFKKYALSKDWPEKEKSMVLNAIEEEKKRVLSAA